MGKEDGNDVIRLRLVLAVIGGIAGLSFWLLFDVLEDIIVNAQLYVFVSAATFAFFASLLALVGPLELRRAAPSAAVIALPSAALLSWASLRFSDLDGFFGTGHPILAFVILVSIPLPYLIAAQRSGEGWRHYPALFDQSWNIVVRYSAAWLFVALVWGVVYLSDALLQIVGLEIIENLLDVDGVPFVLTGFVLGLAIAVVNELSDYVSPFLILRLLRLLLPVFVVVVAIFILALPLRGLSGLFGGLSTAATLMAIAIGAATLVTTALEKRDEDAVDSAAMRGAVSVLSLMTPVLAVLAAYAIWIRVVQYGWTPNRILAALIVVFVLSYAFAYAMSVILRRNWMGRIRRTNTYLALGVAGIAALWLTPVLDPQRLSTANQIARFEAGTTDVEVLDLWEIGREWGLAGAAGVTRLAAMEDHPQAARLAERLERLSQAQSRYVYDREAAGFQADSLRVELRERIVVRPEGPPLPVEVLARLGLRRLMAVRNGCDQPTPGGNPGCVAVVSDLLPLSPGAEFLIFYIGEGGGAEVLALTRAGSRSALPQRDIVDLARGGFPDLEPRALDRIIDGDFSTEPAQLKVLRVEDIEIFIKP